MVPHFYYYYYYYYNLEDSFAPLSAHPWARNVVVVGGRGGVGVGVGVGVGGGGAECVGY